MNIKLSRWYVEHGASLPFSHKMQFRIDDELAALVGASAKFLGNHDMDWTIRLHLTPKLATIENSVVGPHIYKKWKEITYTLHPPFDIILRAPDGPRCALRFLFDGIRTVLHRYEIDTTKLDANQDRIIDEICSNPEMFDGGWENRSWPTLANYKPPPPPAPEDPTKPAFRRVYKRIGGILHYESVFAHDGIAHHQTGKVGHKGKTKELPYNNAAPKKAVDTFLGVALAKGFTDISEDHEIELQYVIDGFGTEQDLEKLHALEDHLHDLLGSLGLGVCYENSIGSGTMEVSCYVVDADIAMKCIKKSLKGTRFSDYATIHVVEHDEEDGE